jgi:hypothetical protein
MGLMEVEMLVPMSVGKASTHQHPSLLKIEEMSMSMGLMEAEMLLPMSVGKASTHQHPSLLKIEDFDFIGKVCCFDLLSLDFM